MITIVAACTSLTPSASPTAVPTPTTSQQTTTPSPAPATASPSPSASPSIAATASAAATPTPSASATASAGPTTPPAGSAYEQLLAHIPPAYREDCSAVTSFDTGFVVGIQCINIASVDGYLVYYQYDSVANMNAAYQSDVEFFGSDATGSSCQTEAAEGGYTIGGTPAGRLMCADYDTGLIAYWTHEGFAILSSIVLFEGTYPDLYAIWLIAGPDPAGSVPSATPTSPSVSWTTNAADHQGWLASVSTTTVLRAGHRTESGEQTSTPPTRPSARPLSMPG